MTALYQLTAQFRELQALGATEEIDEQALLDTLEGLQGELTAKATNVAFYARNLETFAATVEAAAKELKARAERIQRRADAVRGYLLTQLQGAGITKIEAPEFTIAIRKNPPAVRIAEGAEVPAEFMVSPEPPPPRPDKKALLAALKAGRVIDGCSLEAGERLEIRA